MHMRVRVKNGENEMNYPRVTSILAPFSDFSMVPPNVLAAAGKRGAAVHEASLAYALGLWKPVPEDLQGYLDSFKRWFDRFVIEVLAVEKELIHPQWGYVGHADLVALVSGYKAKPVVCVPDLKTPVTASRTWACQIAAYVEAEQLEHKEKVYGGALQLRKDGGLPKMTWVEDQSQAFNAFVGILSGWNYLKGGK